MTIENLSSLESIMIGDSRLDRELWRISRRKRKAKIWASININKTGVLVGRILMMKFQLSAQRRWRQSGTDRIRDRRR